MSQTPLKQARNENAIEAASLNRVLDRDWSLNRRGALRTGSESGQGGWKTQGGGKHTVNWVKNPSPKTFLDPQPTIRFPPLFFAALRPDQPQFLRPHSAVRFRPPKFTRYVLPPPSAAAQQVLYYVKTFCRTFLQNHKGSAQFWGTFGSPRPVFCPGEKRHININFLLWLTSGWPWDKRLVVPGLTGPKSLCVRLETQEI